MRPVLVIEDDQDCRELLQRWLDLLGVPVLTANHGAEGLRVARKQKPCLILLDFMMPIMGGREFRLIQAADSAINDVPATRRGRLSLPERSRDRSVHDAPVSGLRRP
jgi:CheY-like chemotaxis protein